MKSKLLVVELWGLGDLVIATPFLRAVSGKFDVTLVAKPYGKDLQRRFWPDVNVIPFLAPWTAFKHKYRLYKWPWRELLQLQKQIGGSRYNVGLSARWDPRDHILLSLAGARERIGFPRMASQIFLTRSLARPEPQMHRFEYWRVLGRALGVEIPDRNHVPFPVSHPAGKEILVHSGAGQPVRVWPLERYRDLVARLRAKNYRVQVACDPDQQTWWAEVGEPAAMPRTVTELLALMDRAAVFIGNDSGPGHLAGLCGLPTFTLFGPQLSEWFAPMHRDSEWMEGKACPYKPCSDYCRFPVPICLHNLALEEVWQRVREFVGRHV
jgi:ADP-heptose:LPS heptosyltransferase